MTDTIIYPRDISVKPQGKHIDAFSGFFGMFEMDVTALAIVELCQSDNEWREFSLDELLGQTGSGSASIARHFIIEGMEWLAVCKWVVISGEGLYSVTQAFKKRCKEYSNKVS